MKRNNQKLNIAFLDFDDIKNPLLAGGQARATFEVARRLVKQGNKVTVISSMFPNSKDSFNQGIFYKHIGLGTKNIKLNNVAFFAALPFAILKLRADVIFECFTAPISTCFSPVFTKVPVIGMPTMFEAEEFSKKYHLPFHYVERFGARFYKYFLAYSALNKYKMKKLNPKIVTRIIPNGIGEESFGKKVKDGKYALFIGRIDIIQKGLDLLLDAMQKIIKRAQIRLIIAGNGPQSEERKLRQIIAEKQLSARVTFVGRVDGKKKEKLLAQSMFGIYPSRFEDFPLVPLEFLSLKKPIVCFDVKGLTWLTNKVAIKAKAFDVNDLAKAIVKMTNNKRSRESLKRNCRPFARKYRWDEIAKEYEQFCREVIQIDKNRHLQLTHVSTKEATI